ncbi:MAG: hypothetical protein ACLS28_24170 [Clostridium neonatale]
MDIMQQVKLFTVFAGGALTFAETYSYFMKIKTDKLATGEIISSKDIRDITGDTGLILSKDTTVQRKVSILKVLYTFGPTGSGKTTSFVSFRIC